jgi:hypothetical protein
MNFASALNKVHRWSEAEVVLHRAIEALESAGPAGERDVAIALGMLAETLVRRDRPGEAIELLERAKDILAGRPGEGSRRAPRPTSPSASPCTSPAATAPAGARWSTTPAGRSSTSVQTSRTTSRTSTRG